MDEKEFYIHDAYMAQAERREKRLWILCIIIFLVCAISNFCWICYENQFDVIEQEVTQETDNNGINNFYGGDYYGEADN